MRWPREGEALFCLDAFVYNSKSEMSNKPNLYRIVNSILQSNCMQMSQCGIKKFSIEDATVQVSSLMLD